MAFQVSPGINVSEIDLTAGAKTVSVSDAAFAGPFQWGPGLEIQNIDSEDQLVRVFGKPDDTIYSYWFAAQSFLAYSNLLRAVRALSNNALNATSDARILTGAVKSSNGSHTWTNSASNFVATTLVPGQKVLVGDTVYTVDTVATNAFDVVEAIPVKTFLTTLNFSTGSNVAALVNASVNAQTVFAPTQTLYVNGSVSLIVSSVPNSTHVIMTTSVGFTNASTVVVATNYIANTVEAWGVQVANSDDYDANYANGLSGSGAWVGKWPGVLGDSLRVSVCSSANAFYDTNLTGSITVTQSSTAVTGSNTLFLNELIVGDFIVVDGRSYQVASIQSNTALTLASAALSTVTKSAGQWARKWQYANQFDRAPGTSTFAQDRGGASDELHIVIVDEDGKFTGTAGTVLERFAFVSKGLDAKTNNGDGNYYVNVVNRQSQYIWWLEAPGVIVTNFGSSVVNTTFGVDDLPSSTSLYGGNAANEDIDDGDLERAYDLFDSADTVDISMIIAGPAGSTLASYLINNLAEVRKDCIVFCSPSANAVINNGGQEVTEITSFRNALPDSSFGVLDSGWKYTYDKWNDKYRWVPLNGDMAGISARSDSQTDPWFSPAGFTRGNVKNVVKLAWNPKQQDRDDLYKIGVNPVVSFPSQGVVLYGDKTLLTRPSAFDRINVRRLFIILEKTISRLAQSSLFEFNDEFTRSQFRNIVEPYLRDVKARRGVVDYRVICDDTNNTAEVIEQNRFVGDIFVKPARSINFIQLNFVAVRSGVSFQEVTGAI